MSGVAPGPIQLSADSGIGFQIFALLEESVGGHWVPRDSIKVCEGVWPRTSFLGPPPGPGLSTIAPRPGIGSTTSDPQLKVFKNISTRCKVQTGDKVLIGGFIVTGNSPEKVIIRALGPSLQVNGTPLPGRLLDPILELHKPDGSVVTNDNWRTSQATEIQATGLAPKTSFEAAIVATLEANKGYTAIVKGQHDSSGLALVEVYDLGTTTDSQVINISSRSFVGIGDDVMIAGTIVGGSGKLLVRALGPSLEVNHVPIQGRLLDPTLELYNGSGQRIKANDDWITDRAPIQATGLAPTNDKESAILISLLPGGYTAIVRGQNNSTGIGLVECYNVP